MGKPPATDQQLEQRVAALEQRADITDQDLADLELRVTVLENAATTPPVTPPGGEIDNTLPIPPEPPVEPIVPPEPPVVGGLSATYVVPSGPRAGSYVYSEAGGDGQTVTVLDDYVDPDGAFTMTCIAVTRADAPLQVIFRQVPGWACIIFECCDALATSNQHMMPSHGDSNTVIISDSGIAIETVEMWGQWALGRWRWQSNAWPFPKDPTRLRERKLLPLFDGAVLGTPPPAPAHVEYIPMHIPPGAPIYMPQGGDPTLLTTTQGYWGANPNADTLGDMLRAAEGMAAYPWFMRDPTTGGVPDIWRKYPTKTEWMPAPPYSFVELTFTGTPGTYIGDNLVQDELGQKWGFQWQPYAVIGPDGHLTNGMNGQGYPGGTEPSGPFTLIPGPEGTPAPPSAVTSITKTTKPFVQGSGLTIDEAHSGSIWPFPWIATGDPYYLEAMHAKYVFVWMGMNRPLPRPKLAYGQIRETAWKLTSLMLSAVTTPETAPSWLLPRDLWQQLWGDEMRLWDAELVHGTTPGSTVFHTLGVTAGGAQEGPQLAPWQEDMILQVVSWAAMLMPDCKWMAEWKAQDEIARTNGTSGWNQYMPSLYYLQLGPQNGVWYQSWAEAWSHNHTPPEPTVLTTSADYCGQLRAGMAFATQAGVAGVQAPLASLTTNMMGVHYTDGWNRLFAAVA